MWNIIVWLVSYTRFLKGEKERHYADLLTYFTTESFPLSSSTLLPPESNPPLWAPTSRMAFHTSSPGSHTLFDFRNTHFSFSKDLVSARRSEFLLINLSTQYSERLQPGSMIHYKKIWFYYWWNLLVQITEMLRLFSSKVTNLHEESDIIMLL